jgi:class 3 adenylate cyclase/tetratricopeptide (TPR) repeat protein
MRCPACQFENPSGMRFCGQCGNPLAPRCPQCGAEVPAGFRFCGQCGAGLQPAAGTSPAPPAVDRTKALGAYTPKHLAEKILKGRSALEGERRQVTVLFADVAGFTAVAEQRDPEEVHQIIDRCFELITAEVHRFEGTINQYTGDGVMALFGAPIAHEDSPRRAVHAALAIQRALRDLSRTLQAERGLGLQMRIGINTGPVVVGRIGDDLRMDYTAVGDTTNLAARLQQMARPGSVLISEATHRLVGGFFETLDLGEAAVKGHTPVRTFEVLRARVRRARLDVAVERGLTPLVGRERELGILGELYVRAKRGQGQVVQIAGDAGIGKSRLLLEFHRRLAEAGESPTWLEGRCISFGQSIPLLPVIDQLRENFRIEELDGEPEIIAKVEHGMRRMGQLEEHIPYIRYVLSVDPGDPAVTAMDASARRKRIFDAVLALSLRGTEFRPIVFVFEDLHWIDRSSEEYVTAVVDAVAGARILLVLTYRLGYTPPFGTRSFATLITLTALSEAEALAMAGRVLGSERFPPELRAALMDKAEGVPLFVEEVTKTLLDLGVIRRENGGYRMVKGIAEVGVPDTIQGIIMARLDRLGEEGKRTVQLASVIGRQFLRRLLERIAGLTGELEGLLRELKSLEIIYEQGLLPEPAYIFKHAVIQDVAYNSLLVQRRKELHRAVGYAIEELYADRLPEHYQELAHHFGQAEEWSKAMEYSAKAGEQAADAFANAEAAQQLARALEAAGKVAPPPEPRMLARLHGQHGTVLMALGEYDPSVAEYERALDLGRRIGDRKLEAETLATLGDVYNYAHRPDRALEHIEQALAIADELNDRALQAVCRATIVQTRGAAYGQLAETSAHAEQAIRLSHEVTNARLRARTLLYIGTWLQWRGDYERALPYLQQGVEVAEGAHAGFLWGIGTFVSGNLRFSRGEYEEALQCYQRLQAYASAAGDKFFAARVLNLLGGVYLELFDRDSAIKLNVEGDEVAQKLFPWPEPRGHALVKAGLAHLGRGDLGLADEFFARASALLEQDLWGRWRWHMALLQARGELALAAGRHEEAARFAAQALEMATRSQARKHVSRAQALQGVVMAATGRLEEAAAALIAAVELAERLGTPREIWTGKAALGKVLSRLGRDKDAEARFAQAAQAIDGIAGKLTTPGLRQSFLSAEPVAEVYRALGRRPPG